MKLFTFLMIVTIEFASARLLYVNDPRDKYETYGNEGRPDQASRDLDMTFSAGEPAEPDEIHPRRKALIYPSAERYVYDLGHDLERPVYYRLADMSPRRAFYAEPLPYERNRKLVQLDNPQRGEVVLELRVIANNNNNNYNN